MSLDPENTNNYRPIANSSFLSKMLEKVVSVQLKRHLEKYSLLDPQQSAYRKFHSTETCLLKTANDFCYEFDKGNSLLVIALDLTAAFDTIDLEILDQIIEKRFFITGTCKEWIMSYITNRKQQT